MTQMNQPAQQTKLEMLTAQYNDAYLDLKVAILQKIKDYGDEGMPPEVYSQLHNDPTLAPLIFDADTLKDEIDNLDNLDNF